MFLIVDCLRDWLWLRRYNKAMKRTGGLAVCFHCLQTMSVETGYVLTIRPAGVFTEDAPPPFYCISILCLNCHMDERLTSEQRMNCYWRWFIFKSGLPKGMWVEVESAFIQDRVVNHGD